jgi:6-phosphogluconolactonase
MKYGWKQLIESFDDRRDIVVPGKKEETLTFCVEHFISIAQQTMSEKGTLAVALSGGSTPKAIYELLASQAYRSKLDWNRVKLFWSDERCVPPSSNESNYHVAMEAGFASLPIPANHIFRMPADSSDLESAAKKYEETILENVQNGCFDLLMLGMGEDGHTASLFPKTHGLHAEGRLVVANYIPQKNSWRMTFTFSCINNSHEIAIYVLGKSKAEILKRILTAPYEPDVYPIQAIGTRMNKALWIVDAEAASEIF